MPSETPDFTFRHDTFLKNNKEQIDSICESLNANDAFSFFLQLEKPNEKMSLYSRLTIDRSLSAEFRNSFVGLVCEKIIELLKPNEFNTNSNDGWHEDEFGWSYRHFVDGKIHRLDGPAIIHRVGGEDWCLNGVVAKTIFNTPLSPIQCAYLNQTINIIDNVFFEITDSTNKTKLYANLGKVNNYGKTSKT